MAQPLKRYPKNSLLDKEIETQGELLDEEQLERKAEIDQLKIQFEALKQAVAATVPGFSSKFESTYAELLQNFDPEREQKNRAAS